LVEDLVPTQQDMENDVFVEAVNHSQVGIGDSAYPFFDVQAYMAEHQRLVAEHKDLLSRVSILEDDMRILKANKVDGRENIPMPSSMEVGSGSKHVGVKCSKIDADNDGLKSEAGKAEENDGMKLDDEDVGEEEKKLEEENDDGMKVDDEDVGEEEKKMEEDKDNGMELDDDDMAEKEKKRQISIKSYLRKLYLFCTHEKARDM
jgi:hypothetical protein